MFESLISIESLLAISVGALISFRISKLNLNIRNDMRIKSPDVHGNNNQIIYNEVMTPVRKEIAFSVKVCACVMVLLFHVYPQFFVNLVFSLSFLLPVFCLLGVINSIRLNGFGRAWDILYPLSSLVMAVFFYCSGIVMLRHISLYPQLASFYEYFSNGNAEAWLQPSRQMHEFVLIVLSSFACPVLILAGFYLAFAYTKARSGNDAFRFSLTTLVIGYFTYLSLTGVLFSSDRNDISNFTFFLTYPFKVILLLSPI